MKGSLVIHGDGVRATPLVLDDVEDTLAHGELDGIQQTLGKDDTLKMLAPTLDMESMMLLHMAYPWKPWWLDVDLKQFLNGKTQHKILNIKILNNKQYLVQLEEVGQLTKYFT